MHQMFCEQWGDSEQQLQEVQENIQDIQLEHSGLLRCILGMRAQGSLKTNHICIFEVSEVDREYYVKNWPEALQEQLEIDLDQKKLK